MLHRLDDWDDSQLHPQRQQQSLLFVHLDIVPVTLVMSNGC